MLCRDRCGYCTFAQPPARLEAPYLTPAEVLAIARDGARAGCHEALFTLGERPELRYPVAADWLAEHGYASTVEYLVAMCELVLEETGLLPHANAGALEAGELAALRTVAPSQGMMLESLVEDLPAHAGSPDKAPQRRLATLEAAGELQIPFTTGILVGIGETRADRIEALEAIAASHARHGHVQEVIVQNFLPKAGTTMHRSRPCPTDDYLDAIALARMILPDEVHLQAPPNLSDDFGVLLDAGIDDWGGVSPVTADHVNPERPWPALDRLREVTEARGFALAPRLTVYPEWALDADRWLDAATAFPVLDRSDAEALGRDDPGAMFPEKMTANHEAGTGAEVVAISTRGNSSTAWYSGAPVDPPRLIPSTSTVRTARGPVHEVLTGVLAGQEVGHDEIVTLFGARGPEVAAVAEVADELRRRTVGDTVTYVKNRNINYTNVCTFKCRFCGFSKGPLSLNLRGHALPVDVGGHRGPHPGGPRRGGHRGVPGRRDPPELRRRLLPRRVRGREGGGARDARPRLHRARGDRGRQASRRAPRRSTFGASWRPDCVRCPARRPRSSTTRSAPSCAPTRSTPGSGSRRTGWRTPSGSGRT